MEPVPSLSGKTVLLICMHFPPSAASGAFRMLGFVRHLPAHGWSPVVVAGTDVPFEPTDVALQGDVPPHTPIYYVPYPAGYWMRAARRAMRLSRTLGRHATWCYAARTACEAAIKLHAPDVILTSGPPHSVHLLGRWLKRRHGIPLVTDYRDPWIARGRHPVRPLQRNVMRAADGIIANAPLALEQMATRYPDAASRMTVIPNGFDPFPVLPDQSPRDNDEPVMILHAGELYAGRDPRPLLDAMALAELAVTRAVPWHLRFLGGVGGSGVDILAEARQRGLRSRVTVEGQLPYRETKQEMQRADILLLIDSPGRRVGVPAKTYEYIGAGRPILALAENDGDTAWALNAGAVPYCISPPDDRSAIARALADCGSLRARCLTDEQSLLSRSRLAGALADFMEGVAVASAGLRG
jgi:glycosyltransferase involved in cell wall biosynthesis